MNSSTSSLCTTCSSVPIRSFFQPNYPEITPAAREPHEYSEPMSHALLADILARRTECNLCRLIAHAINAEVKQHCRLPFPAPEDLVNISIPDLFAVPNDTKIRCYIRPEAIEILESEFALIPNLAFRLIITLRLEEESKGVKTTPGISKIRAMIQLLGSNAESLNIGSHHLGRIVGSTLDIGMIRRWFDICEKYHAHTTPATQHVSPLSINVIDIHERRIHTTGTSDGYIQYAALSYTWGGDQKFKLLRSNFEQWSTPHGLPDIELLPRTIKDAINLAKELGQRYIWIDALCIVQDDAAARDVQLQQMDRIYELAQYTIVTAAGSNADAGLPGLTPHSRHRFQLVENVQGVHLAVPFPTLLSTIASTIWATRGWTYQEQLISHTMIVFTPHQVYFQCDRKVFQEDVRIELEGRLRNITWVYPGLELSVPMERLNTFRTSSLFIHEGSPTGIFERYKKIVEVYTKRDFGYPGDMLAGFTGITTALQKAPGSMGYVGGLSVAGFEDALLWVPNGPLKRRKDSDGINIFPSWTWIGWVGECQIEWVSDPQAPYVKEWFAIHGKVEESSRLPIVNYNAIHFRNRPTTGPFSAMGTGSWGLAHSHALEFTTSVGSFFLSEKQHFEPGFPVLSRRVSHIDISRRLNTLYVFNDWDQWVGTVMMTETEAKAISSQVRREFLVISTRGSPVGCYADPSLFSRESQKGLNVLMVERAAGGYMERLAAGIIHKDAWEASATTDEYVRLV